MLWFPAYERFLHPLGSDGSWFHFAPKYGIWSHDCHNNYEKSNHNVQSLERTNNIFFNFLFLKSQKSYKYFESAKTLNCVFCEIEWRMMLLFAKILLLYYQSTMRAHETNKLCRFGKICEIIIIMQIVLYLFTSFMACA